MRDASGAAIPDAEISLQLHGSDKASFSTKTTAEGAFTIPSVPADVYDLVVDAKGFAKTVIKSIKVDPGRDLDVPAVKLEVSTVSTTVEVSNASEAVQTTNAEVSTTISNTQIQNLPITDRSPLGFLHTQAGVSSGRTGLTTIDGQRTSYVNVTVDGINVQDNFIRTNDADFLPNLLLLDQVSEVTVSNSNASSLNGGGSSQVNFITPSGSNQYHGNAYWSNRNNYFAANSWFNNQAGVKRAFLNQNQVGGSVGGFIVRNKLFFYTNYEAYRQRQQTTQNGTVLTPDARNGIFTYVVGGVAQKANLFQLLGLTPDPTVAKLLAQVPNSINNFNKGDSTAALLRNTAGYQFLVRDNRTRDNTTARVDYNFSTRNTFSGSYIYNRDILDRPDVDTTFDTVPNVSNSDHVKLFVGSWRFSPQANFTNEVRSGFNLAPATFPVSGVDGLAPGTPSAFFSGTTFTNPVDSFLAQGRFTNTFNYADNAAYVHGRHAFQFGFQAQVVHIEQFNYGSIVPSFGLGIGTGHTGLQASQLPGISATDLTAANGLIATLAGLVTSDTQLFNVTTRTSGYVPNAGNIRHDINNDWAIYGMDTWKVSRRLTATLGVRWDYMPPVDERDALALLPVLQNNNVIQTILGNGTLNFAGNAVGRPWYKADKNNFAPNIGLAWDPKGDGQTAIRAGYSVSYVNDNVVRATDNSQGTNAGLSTTVSASGLKNTVAGGLPAITTPTFQVPISFASIYALNSQAAFAMPSPDLVTPYVQQWNISIQHAFSEGALKNFVIEGRYLGNHGTKEIRGFDYNQVIISQILPDFLKAQSNGFLALQAKGTFDPSFNPAITGSQQLPFFAQLPSGGLLTNSTIRSLIQTGQVGELASTYQINALNGPVSFFESPYGLGMNVLTNYGNSTFNALQLNLNRRFANGLQFQMNYQYAKALSDTAGSGQTDFEPFLDINNAKIEKAPPADYDIRQTFKANGLYQLPIGTGHHFNYRPMARVLDGWNIAGIFTAQTGSPFSVTSGGRGTLNRAARSGNNEATPLLSGSSLSDLFNFRMTGNGPYFIASSAIGSDGRGVSPDGTAPFQGQAFVEPGAGTIGALQRDFFYGPSVWDLDFHIAKVTKIREGQSLELRMDSTNIFNHPTFSIGDQSVQSTTFGKITSTFYGRRLVQFELQYRF